MGTEKRKKGRERGLRPIHCSFLRCAMKSICSYIFSVNLYTASLFHGLYYDISKGFPFPTTGKLKTNDPEYERFDTGPRRGTHRSIKEENEQVPAPGSRTVRLSAEERCQRWGRTSSQLFLKQLLNRWDYRRMCSKQMIEEPRDKTWVTPPVGGSSRSKLCNWAQELRAINCKQK